jgi:hypothetical protein
MISKANYRFYYEKYYHKIIKNKIKNELSCWTWNTEKN